MTAQALDAVVVGGGPNGLAAAISLARAGHSVRVLERASEVGGGSRSAELTLPGFVHDVCSSIHPFGRTAPFFREAALDRVLRCFVVPMGRFVVKAWQCDVSHRQHCCDC